MKWKEYTSKFEEILNGTNASAPYDNPSYLEYVKLNNSRSNRWMKRGELTSETIAALSDLRSPMQWILITEPWCGDAAHSAPFIHLMAEASPMINLDIQQRDSVPSLIDDYLTNGGKSIPKLIVRDEYGNDLFTWGSRPEGCQNLVMDQKTMDITTQEKKAQQQAWYNKDKGVSIQEEINSLISSSVVEHRRTA
ncbi:MAG: thioredoxin family protein [Crocinitomicaceae bacterium]|nr:thioredoxin family protein [Crocinitomicaceae bacterium]